MFLKSIEIRGFKSFADKTDLIFKKGVTSVVGPNGSGKSNISDAVRWVLGEQSVKSLRGGRMEDVIFAGTQFRKPVSLAQVSLTLDNSDNALQIDYSDVTVTRRLYRSGESEYFINTSLCRLRDIQELFMDTGIGKEGYSIIGQGKIDAILSGKPEDRRALLEEAAGIVKYKTRKEEAIKKLNNTEDNLVRINDIYSTYEERLGPLEEDSKKAREFITLSENLKHREINIILYSIERIDKRLISIEDAIKSTEVEYTKLSVEREECKAKHAELQNKQEAMEEQISENQDNYFKYNNKLQELQSEVVLTQEKINNYSLLIEKSSQELKLLYEKKASLIELKNSEEKTLEELQLKQKQIDESISLKEKALITENDAFSENNLLIKKLKEEQFEIISSSAEAKNKVNMARSQEDSYNNKLIQLEQTCESYKNSLSINESTRANMEKEQQLTSNNILELNQKIKSCKKTMSDITISITALEKQLKEKNYSYTKTEANLNLLSNLESQYEGYARSSKNLMQHIDEGKIREAQGKCQLLGEVITAKREHSTAIEIALGAAISDIITEDSELAKGLIKYLKHNKLGRVTFLPLSDITSKKLYLSDVVAHGKGFLGIASDLVSCDKRYIPAVEYVLGRTVICDTMDNAVNLSRLSGHSIKIVTLEGEVVSPGGALTGGSMGFKSSNVLGRKQEIEALKGSLQVLKEEVEELNKKIEGMRTEYKKKDEESLNYSDVIYNHNIEITKIEEKIKTLNEENIKLRQNLQVVNREIKDINELIVNIKGDVESCKQEVSVLALKEAENIEMLSLLEEKLKGGEIKIQSSRDELTAARILKAQQDEIVLNKIKDLERVDKDIFELNEKLLISEQEIKRCEAEIVIQVKTIEGSKDEIEKLRNNCAKLEESKLYLETAKVEVKEKIKALSEYMETFLPQLNKLEDEKRRQEVAIARLDTEKSSHMQKLNEELNLTYAEALAYKTSEDLSDTYKKDIVDIKNRIGELGTVNLGAINEYEEVKNKLDFMKGQREDLINSKEELLKLIDEMTSKMRHMFNENFNVLRGYFNDTFRELFDGGRADLILGEGDELSANIEINVEPPGKKLQNINLMSGGEKVLSAIALLFSILKMKPTPFCILDEIEAALDDANVSRYAKFLKKLSNNIQFIVITHRKGTMECSDALYGVTMEEKGVSKIISVDLVKA